MYEDSFYKRARICRDLLMRQQVLRLQDPTAARESRAAWPKNWAETASSLEAAGITPDSQSWVMIKKNEARKRHEARVYQTLLALLDLPSDVLIALFQCAEGEEVWRELDQVRPQDWIALLASFWVDCEGSELLPGKINLHHLTFVPDAAPQDAIWHLHDALLYAACEVVGVGGRWGVEGVGARRVPRMAALFGGRGKQMTTAQVWDAAFADAVRILAHTWHVATGTSVMFLRPIVDHVEQIVLDEIREEGGPLLTGLSIQQPALAEAFGPGASLEQGFVELGWSHLPPEFFASLAFRALALLTSGKREMELCAARESGTGRVALRLSFADLRGWSILLERALAQRGVYEGAWLSHPAPGQAPSGERGEPIAPSPAVTTPGAWFTPALDLDKEGLTTPSCNDGIDG